MKVQPLTTGTHQLGEYTRLNQPNFIHLQRTSVNEIYNPMDEEKYDPVGGKK
jgi:hypothetical protein